MLLALLVASFFACILWQTWINLGYSHQMPASPQQETGRVYRIEVNHGAVRYVTREEFARANFALNYLYLIEFSLLAVVGVLGKKFYR